MTPLLVKIIFAFITAGLTWVLRHPLSRIGRVMLASHGPRIDVAQMNRTELFGSSLWFLGIGVVALVAGGTLVYLAGDAMAESALLLCLFVFLMFPASMCIGAAIYLLARGLLRRPPPQVADSAASIMPR